MARKPNYRFERMERDRQKAAKKAARAEAKRLEKENQQNAEAGIGAEAAGAGAVLDGAAGADDPPPREE
jgi:hypothetical protein